MNGMVFTQGKDLLYVRLIPRYWYHTKPASKHEIHCTGSGCEVCKVLKENNSKK